MIQTDVPSPIDLRNMKDAIEWEHTAMQRPFRKVFFRAFLGEILALGRTGIDILELGSGPGFLAQYLLSRIIGVNYTLFDFSGAMHELARQRLSSVCNSNIQFLERSFKDKGWSDGISQVNVVVTNQAVHELRHKRYAPEFFVQVRELLKPNGVLLFCDHYCGDDGMTDDQLYMNRSEQNQALEFAGFSVAEVLVKGGRVLYRALPNH